MTPSLLPGAVGRRRAESGFVLIGVVIFVLALTILGLSLFSLSGFETQFLEESRHDLQAFYYASGGLERARHLLEVQGDLEAVGQNLSPPLEGVDFARACYVNSGECTGTVDWTGGLGPIVIQVRGIDRDRSRTMEARFDPKVAGNPYQNLIASHSFVLSDLTSLPHGSGGTAEHLTLNGPIRQKDPDTSWVSSVPGAHAITVGDVPLPDVDAFLAAHPTRHTIADPEISGGRIYHLDLGGVQFYEKHNSSVFGFREDGTVTPVTIRVSGTAIWVCPEGAEFERQITVEGTSLDRLILVAGPSTSDELQSVGLYPLGIHIQGGIQSPQVPVILVSNAAISIDQHKDADQSLAVAYLTVYGASVALAGPNAGQTTAWFHNASSDAAIVDPLFAAGWLPDTGTPLPHQLVLESGSWREIP